MKKAEILQLFNSSGDSERGAQMAAYMRNQFPFLGIGSVRRAELSRPFLLELDKSEKIDWVFVYECFNRSEREFAYLAISYISSLKNNLDPTEISNIEKLAYIKPWWDTIDSIAPLVGFLYLKNPNYVLNFIYKWMDSGNVWLIRMSILFQLKYKHNTNIEILTKAILKNNDTEEFFIDKAIGWALRQYARTNALWVREFVEVNRISKLSKREALKWI